MAALRNDIATDVTTGEGGSSSTGAGRSRAETGAETLARVKIPTDALAVSDSGHLTVDGWSVQDLLEEHGSPLFVLSETVLRDNYLRVRQAFTSRWPAVVNVMYAIKANNNLAVRAVMGRLGAGGDCFSEGEIHATLRGGADPSLLALNGSNKSDAAIIAAIRAGMMINVDSSSELTRVGLFARELDAPVRISIRLKLQSAVFEEYAQKNPGFGDLNEYIRRWPFGVSASKAAEIIERTKSMPGVTLVGYHHHIGRYTNDSVLFRAVPAALAATIRDLHVRTGFWPSVVNVGGGLAREREPEAGVKTDLNPFTVEDYADAVTAELKAGLAGAGGEQPQLWLEPGRYIVGNAGVLVGTVGEVRTDLGGPWVHVDASTNNLARADLGWGYVCLPASRMFDEPTMSADLVGSLCRGGPLSRASDLPDLRRGDSVAFLDAGHYAEVAGVQFNSIPLPATVMTTPESVDVIRTRETLDDVFGSHRIPPRLQTTDN